MWLLDVNMPKKVAPLLGEFGIKADSADERGWAASPTERWWRRPLRLDSIESSHVMGYSARPPPGR